MAETSPLLERLARDQILQPQVGGVPTPEINPRQFEFLQGMVGLPTMMQFGTEAGRQQAAQTGTELLSDPEGFLARRPDVTIEMLLQAAPFGINIGGSILAQRFFRNAFMRFARRPESMVPAMTLGLRGQQIGAVAGDLTSEAVNQILGFSDAGAAGFLMAATAMPIFSAVGRAFRMPAAATARAKLLRAQRTTGIVDNLPIQMFAPEQARAIMNAFPEAVSMGGMKAMVDQGFSFLRQQTSPVTVIGTLTDIATMPRGQRNAIITGLTDVNERLAQRLRPVIQNIAEGNDALIGDVGLNGADLIDLRQTIQGLKDSAFLQGRRGFNAFRGNVRGQALDRVAARLDDEIQEQATLGFVTMGTMNTADAVLMANRVAELNFAARELRDLFLRHIKTEDVTSARMLEFNLGGINAEIEVARRLAETGDGSPLSTLVRFLNRQGSSQAEDFFVTMKELERLSPKNNMLLFRPTFGIVTRGAALATDIIALDAMTELFMSRPGRALLADFAKVTGGQMTTYTQAMLMSTARAMMGLPESGADSRMREGFQNAWEFISRHMQQGAQFIGQEISPAPGNRPRTLPTTPAERRSLEEQLQRQQR